MEERALSSGLKVTRSLAAALAQTAGGLRRFFLGVQFGLLALLFGPCPPPQSLLGVEHLGVLTSLALLYHLFVLSSLVFVGLKLRRLGRRCREILELCKNSPADARCAACGARIQSWRVCLCDDFRKERSRENGGGEAAEGDSVDGDGDGDGGVAKLRREIAKERELRAAVMLELEKERKAAASAVDEAMAKIQWLQNEKALVEREARQYRAMAEQKQSYDRQVIEALEWIISKLGGEKAAEEEPIVNCDA